MQSKSLKRKFDSQRFQRTYHCSQFLGSLCTPEWTLFSLWAPTAQKVTLRLFRRGSGGEPFRQMELKPEIHGRWSCRMAENLDGVYYDYLVTVGTETRATGDPYARACGLNGERSMVIDLSRTDPEGWEEDVPPPRKPEAVIYEIHVKDFSCHPASGVRPEWRGKYLGLTQEGTTLNWDGIHPTCLDWVKGLGVTHVQLMPVYDYGSVDEGGSEQQFNWGYDPMNYNVPEGSYATDPEDGAVRIRELKQAVQALHRSGLRVIMDVVYNHTYRLESSLWKTVPWYFYRQDGRGRPTNGSGCGNDIASERSMAARFILDSVLYWAQEYHMDGFRFDLMGLLDVPLMNSIRQELDRRYGRGEKLMLGEPWAAGNTGARPGTVLAHKGNMDRMDPEIAAFCDATRDAVKGSLFEEAGRGFVNGGGLDEDRLVSCLGAWCEESGQMPSQVVSYLSCHDDWTLWDRLVNSGDPKKRYTLPQPELLRQNRLAAAICLCCQGCLFLLSGEEFGRTKQGCRNSYCSPLEINRLDWELAWENRDLADYYRGLIALRMQLPGLQDKSRQAGQRLQKLSVPAQDCALVAVNNRGGASRWQVILLAFSAAREPVPLELPEGVWEILADEVSSFGWRSPRRVTERILLKPVSALILGLSPCAETMSGNEPGAAAFPESPENGVPEQPIR